jgi:serine/threonine protein kinase
MSDLSGKSLGRYHILEQLGEGGMATVYKARDTRLERDVALKLIRVDQFAPAMMSHILARFEREAKSLARLSHNSIVRVYDYGENDGAPYLVLEFCGGGDLKQRLRSQPMDWREAIGLILPVARALRYSHHQGVIHRDVKPSNIMFNSSGEPMLSDFGIAKMLETDEAATLTGTGVGMGTPGYMAPEQWTGETSPASDQYGLGVVLYELLTGRKPYEAKTPGGIHEKQVTQPLPAPRQFVPEIPLAVESALLKALDKDPAMRYADMASFAKTFEGLLQETQVAQNSFNPVPSDPARTSTVKRAKEKSWLPWAVGAGLSIGLMLIAIWAYSSFQGKPPQIVSTSLPTTIVPNTLRPTSAQLPTYTLAVTQTPEPTPWPTLMVGETRISEKDGMVMVNLGDYLVDQTAITNLMFESFVRDTGYETEVEKVNSGYVHSTEMVCPTWTACKPGVIGQDTRYPVTTWKKAKVSWRSWNSGGQDFVVQISWPDADNYCKWAGRQLLTEQEYIESSSMVKGSGLFEWVKEKVIVPSGEYPDITTPDYSLDALTFRCTSSVP